MKINKIGRFLGLTLAFFTLSMATSYAEHGEKNKEFPHPRMIEELGLTDEQVTQMKELHEKNKESYKEKKKVMWEKKKALQEALQGESSDDSLRALHEEVLTAKESLAKARFEKVLEIRKILTPEQRQKFKGLKDHHRRHYDKKHRPSENK